MIDFVLFRGFSCVLLLNKILFQFIERPFLFSLFYENRFFLVSVYAHKIIGRNFIAC